jgi:hypothetical protein
MNGRAFALAIGLGLASLLAPRLTLAEDHPAEPAFTHAKSADEAKDNLKTNEGLAHLKAFIDEGKKKHIEASTGHAEEPLTPMEDCTK